MRGEEEWEREGEGATCVTNYKLAKFGAAGEGEGEGELRPGGKSSGKRRKWEREISNHRRVYR